MSLNEHCTETGYLLGRLFAVIEKAQCDALGNNINAAIKRAAAATPGVVFPNMLTQVQRHISKAKYGRVYDQHLGGILEMLAVEDGRPAFPLHMGCMQQGLFALGYYHQRKALYRKRGAAGKDNDA